MSSDSLKYIDDKTINFSKELNIDIDQIKKCEHLNFKNYECKVYSLIINDFKERINKMDVCQYYKTNYFHNTNNKIKLTFNDGKEIIISLSDCGKYVGIPNYASGWGIWFYLMNSDNSKSINPFQDLLNYKSEHL